jgi:hypothetical protein
MSQPKSIRQRPRDARYANYFELLYNKAEFILDFSQLHLGDKHLRFHTRIVTAPAYAKALLAILSNSIEQYEAVYGPVSDNGAEGSERADEPLLGMDR